MTDCVLIGLGTELFHVFRVIWLFTGELSQNKDVKEEVFTV